MLLVLLASWTQLPGDLALQEGYQVIELFAGKRRISQLAHSTGLATSAHDIMYDGAFDPKKRKGVHKAKSSMDINESAGFLFLGVF